MEDKEIAVLMNQYNAAVELLEKQQLLNEKMLQNYEITIAKLVIANETLEWFADENNYKPIMRVEEGGKLIDYISQVDSVGVDKANEALVRVI